MDVIPVDEGVLFLVRFSAQPLTDDVAVFGLLSSVLPVDGICGYHFYGMVFIDGI